MTDIPKEIMDKALYSASEVVAAAHDYARVVNIIICALMARDQRAAEIARGMNTSRHIATDMKAGRFPEQSAINEAIAEAILTYKGASDD